MRLTRWIRHALAASRGILMELYHAFTEPARQPFPHERWDRTSPYLRDDQ